MNLTHIRITMTARILKKVGAQLGTNVAILLVVGGLDQSGAIQRIQAGHGNCAMFRSVIVSAHTSSYYVCLIHAAETTKTRALGERRPPPKRIFSRY